MADLSGVLRKTIDGLPRATPQMRAKVYEKARAAIQRQIGAANPPLEDHVVEARLTALEEAIQRTEADYAARDVDTAPPTQPGPPAYEPAAREEAAQSLQMPAEPVRPAAKAGAGTVAASPHLDFAQGPGNERIPEGQDVPERERDSPHLVATGSPEPLLGNTRPPFFPIESEATEDERRRPAEVNAPFIVPTSGRGDADDDDWNGALPAGIRSGDIPEADLSAPRRRPRRTGGAGKRVATALAVVLLLGAAGAAGWLYRGEIESFLTEPSDIDLLAQGEGTGEATPSEGDPEPGPQETAEGEPAGTVETEASRQFTQRLLPDGSEVDHGPAEPAPNAFGEGTDVAAASPASDNPPQVAPTLESDLSEPVPGVIEGGPEAAESDAPAAGTEGAEGIPQVAQDAVFYQERTESAPGTQETGRVVWSLVEEPPAEGQPPEPAIRAQAEVPEENLTMTMTIRRNADPTLPASHVVELLFETPEDFAGGSIAAVQRLTLKGTEQARGEPLIGVAGKISDGFFILALNNLDQAVQNNLNLLRGQNWIDIPIAYSSGRRALLSIEKGEPGTRAFEQAIEAWQTRS